MDYHDLRFTYPAQEFLELFNAVEFAVSKGEDRPAMTGVLWESNGYNRLVATDGYRMALIEGRKLNVKFSIILPVKLIKACLPKRNKKTNLDFDLDICIQDNKIGIRFGNREIVTRLIEGPFPDYERIIPQDIQNVLTVDKSELKEKIRSLLVFTNPITRLIKFSLSKDGVKLSVSSPEGEEMETTLSEYNYRGEEFEVGYSGSYLLDILRHIASDAIVFEITGAVSAALAHALKDRTFFILQMPVLLD